MVVLAVTFGVSAQAQKIGYVDSGSLLEMMPKVKEAESNLETLAPDGELADVAFAVAAVALSLQDGAPPGFWVECGSAPIDSAPWRQSASEEVSPGLVQWPRRVSEGPGLQRWSRSFAAVRAISALPGHVWQAVAFPPWPRAESEWGCL